MHKKFFKRSFFFIVFLFFLIYQGDSQIVKSQIMNSFETGIIEELRLKVPLAYKEEWLQAEEKIWEPWLSKQVGFLGREIFWNKEKEEALLLVNWENRELWKNISIEEVNNIQKKFEDYVKLKLKLDLNPFELIYEGELYKKV